MAAAETNTWDIAIVDGGSRRPSLEDVGGGVLQDHAEDAPPKDGSMHYADMDNQVLRQVPSQAQTTAGCKVTVTFSGSTPSIARIASPKTTIDVADFTIVDHAVGDTEIRWPSGYLPPTEVDPQATCNVFSDSVAVAVESSGAGYNGVRVQTRTGGTLADVRFTVTIN